MDWKKEVSVQRRSMYSNGIIVQTDDCKRIDELINEMKTRYPEPLLVKLKDKQTNKWISERWLILDGWEGLSSFEKDKTSNIWLEKNIADSKKFGGQLRPLLEAVSKELDKKQAVLIVRNILKSEESFNNALRSWSTSNRLRTRNSTIIVFVEDSCVFPESVWSKMKIVDVPKSLPGERKQRLIETQNLMSINGNKKLDDSKRRAAVRILAGLNLDQVDAAIIESIIRDYHVDLDTLAGIKTEMLGKDPALEIIQRPKFGFEAIGGYDALKNRLRDDVIFPLRNPGFAEEFDTKPPRGIILFGPPGTGKTILAKAMSRELNMSMLVMRPENLLSKFVGESERATKRVFKIADSMAPCILWCDELDRLSKRGNVAGGDSGAQVHREIFSMFLEKLGDENREWFFVGCTNRIEDIDEAMRRTGRIDTIAPVPYPNEKARERIFEIHASIKRKLPLADDVNFKVLASKEHTYMWSGSDVEQLVIRTAKYTMKKSIKEGKMLKISMSDFEDILSSFNVDTEHNEQLQEGIQKQAENLTNDTRLMNIFDEAQELDEVTRAEIAKEVLDSEESGGDDNN